MRVIEPWQFILVALAAYRATRFLVFDSLIGSNLESGTSWSIKLDAWAFTADGDDRGFWRGKIGTLLVCPFCVGFYVSLATLAAWWWGPDWVQWIVIACAAAGAQALLNAWDKSL